LSSGYNVPVNAKEADMARRTSALVAAAFGAALLLAATAAALADDPTPPAERQKIERLIAAVEGIKDARFVRNGTEYDGKAAADHMRRKWKRVEKDVHTARDFIRLAATSSIENGKPYLIRFKDGREVESAKFLGEKLDEIEKEKTDPAAPAPKPAASLQ
jgi:uncharacterized membrane protein